MRRRGFLTLAAALAATAAGARQFPSDDTGRDRVGIDLDEVRARGELILGVYEDFPPYSFRDGQGVLTGVDLGVGRLIAQGLGVEARFLELAAGETVDDDLRHYVWRGHPTAGRIVNVMLRVPYSRELDIRNELAAITGRYAAERIAVGYRRSLFPDEAPYPGDFQRHPVAVENHSLPDFYLSRFGNGALMPMIRRRRTMAEACALLREAEVAAVVGPRAQLEWFLAGDPDLGVDEPPLPGLAMREWPVGVATAFYTARMLAFEVDDILTAAVEDGRIAAIYADFGLSWSPPGRA